MKEKSNSLLILILGSLYVLNLFAALNAETPEKQVTLGLISLTFAVPLIIVLILANKK
jgi:uncharacterized integral membrane protein